jgi:hypothetical protein
MAIKVQPNFAAGELDPALRERTALERYNAGLATARNVVIGKTGRLISRPGRKYLFTSKLNERSIILHAVSYGGIILEWGHEYVRIYDIEGTLIGDHAHAFTEDDFEDIQFVDLDREHVLILREGSTPLVLCIDPANDGFVDDYFDTRSAPELVYGSLTGNGYDVEYLITAVVKGEETLANDDPVSPANPKLPQGGTQTNTVIGRYPEAYFDNGDDPDAALQEMRFYRRPSQGGAYGFIGSTTYFESYGTDGSNRLGRFLDIGQQADFVQQPPDFNKTILDNMLSGPLDFKSKTGVIYQQRLLLSYGDRIESSRTGLLHNFFRDYPLQADSSLSFKSGSQGYAKILRMIENDGLIVFTTQGVFVHVGALSPTNLTLEHKGNWIIDERIPPIALPGATIFVDSLTNTVRQLVWSQEAQGFNGEEVSIFSNHLFENRRIVSWAFQEGDIPILWVVYNDGKYASFTYDREHQMRAWARHDSRLRVEFVATTRNGVNMNTGERAFGQTFFVSTTGNKRIVERVIPRYPRQEDFEENPETDKFESIMAADGVFTWSHMLLDDLEDGDRLIINPTDPGSEPDPSYIQGLANLKVLTGDDPSINGIFTDPGVGEVGTIFRWFDPEDGTFIDLEVMERIDDSHVIVQPLSPFPRAYGGNPRLYECRDYVEGMTYFGTEEVSVIGDGFVVASPNNNIQNFPTVVVNGGRVDLPDKYAIINIGRPFTSDIETLDIATVEQAPTLIESITVNKLYVHTYRSRGLFIGSRFPKDGKVLGDDVTGTNMVALEGMDAYDVNYEDENPILANRYDPPKSKRHEITLPGDWKSQGRICIRQVDPLHWELLSIIPDVQVERRRGN